MTLTLSHALSQYVWVMYAWESWAELPTLGMPATYDHGIECQICPDYVAKIVSTYFVGLREVVKD